MTVIKARSKKEFEELKKEYRNNGFTFITFGTKLVELEKVDGEMIVIER